MALDAGYPEHGMAIFEEILKSKITCAAFRVRAGVVQGHRFCMEIAQPVVPAFGDYAAVFDQDAAHGRVGRDPAFSLPGEGEGFAHELFFGRGKRCHGGFHPCSAYSALFSALRNRIKNLCPNSPRYSMV